MDKIEKQIEEFEGRGENIPNAVVVSDSNSPAALTRLALTHGHSLADIEKMLELQERYEKNEAKKAYHKAMAAFKANPPKVWRDMQVKYKDKGGNIQNWSHADLGIASEAIGKGLGEHKLNHTWRTKPQENKETKVTCIITHELGHSEETHLQAGPDTTGSKNAIQAIGSTIFYLERYTLFALTGLAPARMDDDGQGAGSQPEIKYITEDQVKTIESLMVRTDINTKVFLKSLKVGEIKELPATDFSNAMNILNARLKNMKRAPGEEG